jgi:hypothetical protein
MNELIEKIRKAPIADCDGKDQDCINCGEQELTIYTICTKQVKIFLTQFQPYIEAKIEQARKDERERIIKIINKTYAYNCDEAFIIHRILEALKQ